MPSSDEVRNDATETPKSTNLFKKVGGQQPNKSIKETPQSSARNVMLESLKSMSRDDLEDSMKELTKQKKKVVNNYLNESQSRFYNIKESRQSNILDESVNDNVMLTDNEEPQLHSSRIFNKTKMNNEVTQIQNQGENSFMPVLDLGRLSSSHNSNRTPPLHSDDEVTPRRGLDEMMSSRKLLDLELNI